MEKDSEDQKAVTVANVLSQTKKSIGKCRKHKIPLQLPIGGVPIPFCPKCVEDLTERDELKKQRLKKDAKKQRALEKKFKGIQIGRRFQDATFDDCEEVCADAKDVKSICMEYAATFTERLKTADSLIFSGSVGTGKNKLAACIAKAAVEAGHTSLHTTVRKMVRKITRTWKTGDCEQAAIDAFSIPDLLIINEIGVQFETKAEELFLTEIIDDRYEAMKCTILISNFYEKELVEILGERIIDRFYEGGSRLLTFKWKSYRRRG